MNNLKLKNKILLILALPIIAVLVLSSISIFENIEKENKMSKTTEYINFTVKVSEFLTQFQNERELGILYLDSYGKNKKSEFTSQINRSEEKINQLNDFIENFRLAKNDINLSNKIEKFRNELKSIDEVRKNILDLKIDKNEMIKSYNKNIFNLISFFDDLLIYSNNKEISKFSQAYVSLINVIEKRILLKIF